MYAKEIMFSLMFACLSVSKHYSQNYETDCDEILWRGAVW